MLPDSRRFLILGAILAAVAMPCQAEIDAESPSYGGMAQSLVLLDNGMIVQGDDVATPDGYTSGFRLTAGFSPRTLPYLDLGAEFSYRQSDDVPNAGESGGRLLDTTSMGGSLMAGVRFGPLGLYAKSGVAEWHGNLAVRDDQAESIGGSGGTTRISGFGARLQMRHLVSRLEYEAIDAPAMDHLNLMTASVHYPF
ncbi:hypothetical protein [Halomonas aquatica]|uniref:Outer membrane protein beta-barrel domain-containing protein n=1 Tax=Halomonas aquatica TaxID=3151123 RepID=A0ABV1NGR8_9GAMM